MHKPRKLAGLPEGGVALVIVLAFLVLMAVLVVAFLSRTSVYRQVAQSSFNAAKADQLSRAALDIIVGDLKEELSDGSPITSANVLPQRNAGGPAIPNLIRTSLQSDPLPSPGVPSRASPVNSSTPSKNGRSISLARWNRHYLIPPATTSDSTPISGFNAPDWVLITSAGPQIVSSPSNSVIGRYAYAIYNEGGLLDVNVAGLPYSGPSTPGLATRDIGRKGVVALADLTALSALPSATRDLVGWRNYATVQPQGSFGNFTFDPPPVTLGPGTNSTGSRFLTVFLDINANFLTAPSPTPTPNPNGLTDQAIISRGELLALSSSTTLSPNLLQYMGTFSRESNLPTWSDSATRLKGRFPLNRFDLFTNPSGNGSAIQRYFGVKYVAATGNTPEHWQYFGAQGSGLQPSISVLTGNQQDPDLSVLLRYMYPVSSTPDSEILSIIASLIDQRDSDPNTTWIEYGNPANPSKAFGADSIPPTNPLDPRPATPPVMLKRSFRNVGELGYAYRNASTTLDLRTAGSRDAPLLDLFTYNVASPRAGIIDLNSGNVPVIAAILMGATTSESSPAFVNQSSALQAAQSIVTATSSQKALGRADVSRLTGAAGSALGPGQEAQEATARALAELSQTRTWNLMIDLVAQSGRYPQNAGSLEEFVVEGEKRYWLHVAIDRFTGQVIDQQLEAVYE